ncbi:oxidoreductase [Aureibaculum sp. 2210JD6-5]|uniref:sialidase family protein n=1 Tax=Aureibaculum sp. 2210JD6-5 TaxID=3103957 RepID=UPI002AAC730B|nr:oxidoreductase [Aureibaculum sp. 2210JD6-5]MDY7396378.1 oxidoreductase [Aureibaculum sp. 2210JD6-5]
MKKIIFLFALASLVFSCNKKTTPRSIEKINIEEIAIDSSSIRAIYAMKDSSLFYATSDGYLGLILPTNQNIKDKRVFYDTIVPHFRAIASNTENIFMLSIGNPALLYEYNEGNLEIVYKEKHPKVFYDAMAFFDDRNGIAMGDPTDDCLSVILTNNGGKSWTKLPCDKLPKINEGEAAFAASNSNIAIHGENAWLVTGGKSARVFHSPDMGNTWKVYDTPIVQGDQMTGIYSVDFYDVKNGVIFGGDWNNKDNNTSNKAVTTDGGKTWQLVADGNEPGYKSCVQYVPDTDGQELFAVGTTGVSYSKDGGHTWKKVSDDAYYTIRFVNKNFAWLAGNKKIGKLILK